MLGLIQANELNHGLLELVAGVAKLEPVNLAGIYQSVGMLFKPEDRGAPRCVVTADPLEKARPIADDV
jgi:hypothetical protein